MPAIAEISADIANLVDDRTTSATSDMNSRPGSTASTSGPSSPEHSPSPDQRFHQRTSSGVRRPCGITGHTLTSSDSEPAADRPVLTVTLSLGPRDSSFAESSAEDSSMSTGTCQEPRVPPPILRSRATAGTASPSDYVLLFCIQCMILAGTSRVFRHEHLTATDTLPGPRHRRPAPTSYRESKPPPPRLPRRHTPPYRASQPHLVFPTTSNLALFPNPHILGPVLNRFPVVLFDIHCRH